MATGAFRAATEDGETVINAKHVISSAPMRELATRIHPLPQSLPEAQELNYRDFLTVALMVKSEDLFPDNWIYIHDDRVQVGRVQNFRSWSPEMVPDESIACVGLEYFCFENDGLWSSTDEDLVELAKKEMAILGLCKPEDVVGGAVVRQEKAYPVYDDSYEENVEAMRSDLEERFPTLHMVGRNGMHRYNNQDHAMMTAMLTVENIEAGSRKWNVWNVNEDAEYHEAGDEGAETVISEDRAAALESMRDVPTRIDGRRSGNQAFQGGLSEMERSGQDRRSTVGLWVGNLPGPLALLNRFSITRYLLASIVSLAFDVALFMVLVAFRVRSWLGIGRRLFGAGIVVHWLISSSFVFPGKTREGAALQLQRVGFHSHRYSGSWHHRQYCQLAHRSRDVLPVIAKGAAVFVSFFAVYLTRKFGVFR